MIKSGSIPTDSIVAGGTVGDAKGGASSLVWRIVGLLPGGQVATGMSAIGGSDLEIVIVINMAGGARDVSVAVGELESSGAVIKGRGVPGDGVVAGGTIGGGKSGTRGGVRRIVGLLPLGKVAILAGARSEIVVVVDMASGASEIGVPVGKQETCGAVIEFSAEPTIETVAGGH